MLEGEAVRSLTAQFLQMWGILKEPEYEQFLTLSLIHIWAAFTACSARTEQCTLMGGRPCTGIAAFFYPVLAYIKPARFACGETPVMGTTCTQRL